MNKAPDTPEIAQKRAQEKRTMETMVRIFCRGNRHMPKNIIRAAGRKEWAKRPLSTVPGAFGLC